VELLLEQRAVQTVTQHQPHAVIFVAMKVVVDVLSLAGVCDHCVGARDKNPRGNDPRVRSQQQRGGQRRCCVNYQMFKRVGVERGHPHGPVPLVMRPVQLVQVMEGMEQPVRVVKQHVRKHHAHRELPDAVREGEVVVLWYEPREKRRCRNGVRRHVGHDFTGTARVALVAVPHDST